MISLWNLCTGSLFDVSRAKLRLAWKFLHLHALGQNPAPIQPISKILAIVCAFFATTRPGVDGVVAVYIVHENMYVYIYIYACMHVCMYIYMYMYMYMVMYMHMYVYIYACTYTNMYVTYMKSIYIYMYMYKYIYIHVRLKFPKYPARMWVIDIQVDGHHLLGSS